MYVRTLPGPGETNFTGRPQGVTVVDQHYATYPWVPCNRSASTSGATRVLAAVLIAGGGVLGLARLWDVNPPGR